MNTETIEKGQVTNTQTTKSVKEQGKPPGRNSILWDTISDISLFPLLVGVGVMQGALPAVSLAVNKTGTYKYKPTIRAMGSAASLMRFLYDGGTAQKEAVDLREMHANIKGTLDDGSPYFALNPATYRIVPDTLLDIVIRIKEHIGKPLNQEQKVQVFEEYIQLSLMLGIPRKYLDENLKEFYLNYNKMIEEQWEYTEAVDVLLASAKRRKSGNTRKNKTKEKAGFSISKLFEGFFLKHINPILYIGMCGILPINYRELNDIEWSNEEQQKFERMCKKIALIQKFVPRFIRYTPTAFIIKLGFQGTKLITAEDVKEREEMLKIRQTEKAAKLDSK